MNIFNEFNFYYDDLPFVFVQCASSKSNKDVMEGTSTFPCYIVGQLQEQRENIITIVYKEVVGKYRPGMITPKYFKFPSYNIQFRDVYIRNVKLLEEGDLVYHLLKSNYTYTVNIHESNQP